MTRRLGKGFAEIVESAVQSTPSVLMIPTTQIKPGRYQPRQHMDEQALEELKNSIKDHGIIQPILVRPISHGVYELVAGERRWRAAQALGIQEIPAVVRSLPDQEALEYSLIENLQRHNLNSIEEAQGYERLMKEFAYSQDHVAQRVGKDRSTVANLLRLLKLPDQIQIALREGRLTQGHAKALLAIEQSERQLALFQQILDDALSVRRTEELAGDVKRPAARVESRPDAAKQPQFRAIEESLRKILGTKVSLASRRRGGRIVINYFSEEDLARLLQILGIGSGDE